MRFLRTLILLAIFCVPQLVLAQREKLSPEDLAVVQKLFPSAVRTPTGLRTVLEREGHGDPVRAGDIVDVLYTGKLLSGKLFEDAKDPKHPFTFRVGRGLVIDGWEEGLTMMREGEKRLLIVPFELAYGTRGDPPRIPRQSTLVFDVEIIGLHRK